MESSYNKYYLKKYNYVIENNFVRSNIIFLNI